MKIDTVTLKKQVILHLPYLLFLLVFAKLGQTVRLAPGADASQKLLGLGKRYNTPHRSHVVKTRMTEEEYADFTERLKNYDMSQAEFTLLWVRHSVFRAANGAAQRQAAREVMNPAVRAIHAIH